MSQGERNIYPCLDTSFIPPDSIIEFERKVCPCSYHIDYSPMN